ncbi:hypothetical protein [Streptococcus anginosus]|uniref:hypothetical protein n=1 Tax=Streptococcus anginosus TaxID=1328 RepID=UPI002001BBAC|nr:hypothetical protein [Streptococcus anginosus]
MNEHLREDGKEAYKKFVNYLDSLPSFNLSKEEQDYIEEVSSAFDMKVLKEVNASKIEAIENVEKWLKENKNIIAQYQDYKNSLMKTIQDKLQTFMLDNKYYEIAIPLIRKFSKSYDQYYKKILIANEQYLKAREL